MPSKNCDLAFESRCPKCGGEMEAIEMDTEGPPLRHLQLCPGCYLVTWSDEAGVHVRQGIPMKEGGKPLYPSWFTGEPEKC